VYGELPYKQGAPLVRVQPAPLKGRAEQAAVQFSDYTAGGHRLVLAAARRTPTRARRVYAFGPTSTSRNWQGGPHHRLENDYMAWWAYGRINHNDQNAVRPVRPGGQKRPDDRVVDARVDVIERAARN